MLKGHPNWQADETSLGDARLLIQVAAVDSSMMTPQIVWADTIEVRWPEDRVVERPISIPGRTGTLRIDIRDVRVDGSRGHLDLPLLMVSGDMDLVFTGSSRGIGGDIWHGDSEALDEMGFPHRSASTMAMLSMVPSARRDDFPLLLSRFHLVDPADPLTAVPATELLAGRPDLQEAGRYWAGLTPLNLRRDADTPPGSVLIGRMGLGFVLVLAAGMLLARLWRRYLVGVGIMLPAMLAVVVIADRAALSAHTARLMDESLSTPMRMLAAVGTAKTFFFSESAIEELSRVAGGPATAKPLTELARDLAITTTVAMVPEPVRATGWASGSNSGHTVNGRAVPGCHYALLEDHDGPLLLCLYRLDQGYAMNDEVSRIILFHTPTTRRIVIVDSDDYSVRVVGTERDFVEAVASREGSHEDQDVWQRVIFPALYPEEYEDVDE